LFGKLILDLDETPVRPLDFAPGIRAIRASLDDRPITNARLAESLETAANAAAALAADIEAVNLKYLGAVAETRAGTEAAAVGLNRSLYALNRMLRDAFARFDRRGALVLPHASAFANAEALNAALSALGSGDRAAAALALRETDFGRYADYDAQVCDYFASLDHAGTWGAGREAGPVCRADRAIRSLAQKAEEASSDTSAETEELESLLAREQLRLRAILEEELSRIEEILPRIDRAIAEIAPLVPAE
jgi:hypothetical protein